MKKTILKCLNLNKSFGKKHVLKDVSLELEEGDIVAFIGPNGSGKTTTIKLILGLLTIDSGTVTINDFNIEKEYSRAIERVGAIVENPDLYMYLSGQKNLELIANMYKDITTERIQEVVCAVGLQERINDKVSSYSLGMRQRLGIAQSIMHRPNILILDEPTNGLDPEGIKQMRILLTKLAKEEKMAILISSHQLSELENFCTKTCIIKNGTIIDISSIEDLKKDKNNSYYLIEVSSTENLNMPNTEIVDATTLRVNTNKEEIPNIIRLLIKNKIDVYSIINKGISLEEAFLQKTGGNTID